MANSKRDLKAYVRFDGTGRVVPGSLILSRVKPKVGKWKEIPAYLCCPIYSSTLIVTTPQSTEPGQFCADFIFLNGTPANFNLFGTGAFGTIEEIVAYLNANYSNIGAWEVVSATEIGVRLNVEYVNVLGAPITVSLGCGG